MVKVKKAHVVISEDKQGNFFVEGIGKNQDSASHIIERVKLMNTGEYEKVDYRVQIVEVGSAVSGFKLGFWKHS